MRVRYHSCPNERNPNDAAARNRKHAAADQIDDAIKRALDELAPFPDRRAAFLELLAQVRCQTRLLKATPARGSLEWAGPVFLIRRLANVAARRALWIRDVAAWRAKGGSLREEFRSLASHLLLRYAVPAFMDSVWDLDPGVEAFRQQLWFIRAGRGAPLRTLNLPVVLTRGMEHHTRSAPAHHTMLQALRYGDARGVGCDHELACIVAGSRLGWDASQPAFWRTVLHFLANHRMPQEQVQPVIEFIHAGKFAGESVLTVEGLKTRQAPWPGFSVKGRTAGSLLRLVRKWNAELDSANGAWSWNPSGLMPYQFLERRSGHPDLEWSVVELLNSSALRAEGRALRHCVHTYVPLCRAHATTIWSLRVRVEGEEKRKATLQVNAMQRRIVQIRARHNRRPGLHSRLIIHQWAQHAGLRIDVKA